MDKLGRLGIQTQPARILTPPVAAVAWLKAHAPGPVVLFVPPATRSEFEAVPQVDMAADAPASAVVIGDYAGGWNYRTLNLAFRRLMRDPRPVLIALGMTRYWRSEEGLCLDTAPFVVALQHASGCEPMVLGKPSPAFFQTALAQLGTAAERVCMIGDDIRGDVGGAQAAGIRGILVRTGKYRASDLDLGIRPAVVLDSFADLPDWWRGQGVGPSGRMA